MYALSSQKIISLPFNVVPISLQPVPILLSAFVFGWPAVTACFLYLLQGAIGAPIFAGMGGGIAHLLGPTGGYLFGFALAAAFIAAARLVKPLPVFLTFIKIVFAHSIIFTCGVIQLSYFVPWKTALEKGLWPFVVTDFFKILCVCYVVHKMKSSFKGTLKF